LGLVYPSGSAIIDFVEAAYDLRAEPREWLPRLLRAGAPIMDHGLGFFALTCTRPPQPGPLIIDQVHAVSGPEDLSERLTRLLSVLDMELLWPLSRPGMPKTLSEVTSSRDPRVFEQIVRHFDLAKDGLGISALDPNGRGAYLIAALPEVTALTHKSREHWQMLAAHFGAGHRLRCALSDAYSNGDVTTELPHGAEAVIDPQSFRVTDAIGEAKSPDALGALRDAAVHIDRARGDLRERDPENALELWRALVRGRWSTVDWFDSDGRRFMLAVPNAPEATDPRGLTERETQVVAYAFFGFTNKLIAYHLGLSNGRVSTLLGSAMRKLGVQTRAQLMKKLHDFRAIGQH
jgi:DNA-binding CsgD family transcriptional regulator